MKRKLFSILALLFAVSMAWADDVIVKYYDPTAAIGAQRKSVTNPGQITSSTTEIGTADTETWYYVSGTVTNDNRIEVSGTVNLILADGCNFTASKGLHVPSGNALNIYAQSIANRGSLTADNYTLPNYAAIGGNGGEVGSGTNATDGEDSGAITIYGGTITTTNGNIGGGDGGNGTMEPGEPNEPGYGGKGGNGNVTVYSGYIRVNGNIGGGSGGTSQDDYGNDDPYNYGSNGGGTVNLSWTNTEDWICADNYYGTVTLQKDFNGFAKGEVIDNNDLKNVYLMFAGTYYIVTIGSMPEGVTATADLELNAGFKNAVEGQVVTICFSGVPAGKVPVLSVTYGTDNYVVFNIIDNGDGTFSFEMPAGHVIVTASELKKDIKSCTAEVPNQELSGYSYIYYKFEAANSPSNGVEIKEAVKDGETTLTLGTNYKFGSVYYSDMTGYNAPDHVGDKCLVEIKGIGDYAGTIYAPFTIIGESGGGTCGDPNLNEGKNVTWIMSDEDNNGSLETLTISGTGPMMYYGSALGSDNKYHSTAPWSYLDSEIEKVIVENGVTYIGSYAFAYCGALSEVSLPSTVSALGDYVCYSSNVVARIDIPSTTAATLGTGAFDACPTALKIAVPSTLLGTYQTATNWSAYAAKLVGVLSETTGFGTTFATGNYEYTRTFKCGVASTVCLPFSLDAAQAASVGKFYSFAGIDKSGEKWEVIMEQANTMTTNLTANIPYLFVPYIFNGKSQGDAVEFTFSGNVSQALQATYVSWTEVAYSYWTFQGVYYNLAWAGDNENIGKVYGFAAQSYSTTVNPGDFVKVAAGASIAPFRAYLQYTPGTNAPRRGAEALPSKMTVRLVDADGTVTAIGTIDTNTGEISLDSDAWYDLNGRRLSAKPSTAGVYINNGKKIVIK